MGEEDGLVCVLFFFFMCVCILYNLVSTVVCVSTVTSLAKSIGFL